MSASLCPHPSQWGRTMIVAAHPDDEVLALGGHFSTVSPFIFHLTNGAPASGAQHSVLYAERALEMERVLALVNLPSDSYFPGTVADQATVLSLPRLFNALLAAIKEVKPNILLTHPFEGGHPDHDAAALLGAMIAETTGLSLLEFPSYHNGNPHGNASAWKTGSFLNSSDSPVLRLALTAKQQIRKRQMLLEFTSQKNVLGRFSLDEEIFRYAPTYDFNSPPHAGTLLYESFDWNIDFPRWHRFAAHGVATIHQILGRPLACTFNLSVHTTAPTC